MTIKILKLGRFTREFPRCPQCASILDIEKEKNKNIYSCLTCGCEWTEK